MSVDMSAQSRKCAHTIVQLDPSACAARVGFEQVSPDKILAAATASGRNPFTGAKGKGINGDAATAKDVAEQLSTAFPAPLILPGDDLAYDPDEGGQSFRSWLRERERNKPTTRRNTLYVASVPQITSQVKQMEGWKRIVTKGTKKSLADNAIESPDAADLIEFLSVFYHGVPVKPFPHQLSWVPWDGERDRNSGGLSYCGLATGDNCTRIRARPSKDGVFAMQLNLEDILDAAIEMLPADAYSILLLVDHDLYEDEDDDFCCGRAYGGSRVCVVQTARYHPDLDKHAGIDYAHMWPASHCKAYLDKLCKAEGIPVKSRVQKAEGELNPGSMRLAVDAAQSVDEAPSSVQQRRGLWFSRLARTVAHELGHCWGMDHCVYYACMMQSTAGMAEDVRQPPYLCAICVNKVTHAIAGELQKRDEAGKVFYTIERYKAISALCDKWQHVGMFAGYGAWVRSRVNTLEVEVPIGSRLDRPIFL